MALPAVTTAALLSAPLVVLLVVFGHMATSAPTDSCLEGCVCFRDEHTFQTLNCTSFKPVLTAASSLLSDFSHIDVLNVRDVTDGSNEHIIDGLFGVFSNLKYMSLINSSISKVYPGAFKGLKRLEELDLSKNKLFKFNPDTFTETPSLRMLDLSENPLRLSPNTFLVSRSLEELILSSCNLTNVPSGSFKGLPNLKALDLYNNRIQTFTYRSFPKSLRHLWLTKNNLTNIFTKAISSLNKLTSVDISQNPINCTCALIGLQDWFSSRGVIFENDAICAYPPEYEGKGLKSVVENEVCVDTDDTTPLKKSVESSENSCENEMCDENKIDDRYFYNAVQADQPNVEAVTEDGIYDDKKETTTEIVPTHEENRIPQNIDTNKIENLTENKPQSAEKVLELAPPESEKPESEELNLEKNITAIDSTTPNIVPDDTQKPQGNPTEMPEKESSSENDTNKNGDIKENSNEDFSTTTEDLRTSEGTTLEEELTTIEPTILKSKDEDQVITSTVDEKTTQSIEDPTEYQAKLETSSIESTTESGVGKDVSISQETEIPMGQTFQESLHETSTPDISSITIIEQASTPTPPSVVTEVVPEEKQETTVPTSGSSNTADFSVPLVNSETLPISSTTESPTSTTSLPLVTEIIPSAISTNDTITTTSAYDKQENLPDNDATTLRNTDIVTITTEIIPITTPINVAIESSSTVLIEKTTEYVSSTTELPTTTHAATINNVPGPTEVVTEATSKVTIIEEQKPESTNGTGLFSLPSTDGNGKDEKAQESSEHKSESVGSYIVLAGILIVLLLLILYASTKRGNSSNKNKKPMDDTEGNMTELQDMKSLLPSSPVTNGHKNGKYPNEEPSVTAKLLDTDDHPESNGNGYMFPRDVQAEHVETPIEKVQEANGKSTLSRTNGTSNGPPPLELTKAKVIILPESLPRTPIYIQKNVNS